MLFLTIVLNLTPSISKMHDNTLKYNIQDYKIIAEFSKQNIRLLGKELKKC